MYTSRLKKAILILTLLVIAVLFLELTGMVTIERFITYDLSVSSLKKACLNFIAPPDYIKQNESAMFLVETLNCGNENFTAKTQIMIKNSTLDNISQSESEYYNLSVLERKNYWMQWFAFYPAGDYWVIARTMYDSQSVEINKSFVVITTLCVSGNYTCVGDDLYRCDQYGSEWEFVRTCEYRCVSGRCMTMVIEREVTVGGGVSEVTKTLTKFKLIGVSISPIPLQKAYPGETLAVTLTIKNEGEVGLENLLIYPVLPGGWNKTSAWVSNLNVGSSVNRTIEIVPALNAEERFYLIPIEVIKDNETIYKTYFIVEVLKKPPELPSLLIIEYPPFVGLLTNQNETLSLLIKNIGDSDLHRITLRLENHEECIDLLKQYPVLETLNINQITSLRVYIKAKSLPKVCSATIIVESIEGAKDLAPIIFDVKAVVMLAPPIELPWLLLLIVLIIILISIILVILKKRKKKPKKIAKKKKRLVRKKVYPW